VQNTLFWRTTYTALQDFGNDGFCQPIRNIAGIPRDVNRTSRAMLVPRAAVTDAMSKLLTK